MVPVLVPGPGTDCTPEEFLTKITEFLDFGATFDLDRIFSFFFQIGGGCQA